MTGAPLRFAHPTLEADARARDARDIARLVDSTLLRPETRTEQIVALCEEAARLGFRSVCVCPPLQKSEDGKPHNTIDHRRT